MSQGEHWMDEEETAALLHVPKGRLRYWRSKRTGPPFSKAGRKVLYERGAVLAWLRAQQPDSQPES
jgi:hypothetical protein